MSDKSAKCSNKVNTGFIKYVQAYRKRHPNVSKFEALRISAAIYPFLGPDERARYHLKKKDLCPPAKRKKRALKKSPSRLSCRTPCHSLPRTSMRESTSLTGLRDLGVSSELNLGNRFLREVESDEKCSIKSENSRESVGSMENCCDGPKTSLTDITNDEINFRKRKHSGMDMRDFDFGMRSAEETKESRFGDRSSARPTSQCKLDNASSSLDKSNSIALAKSDNRLSDGSAKFITGNSKCNLEDSQEHVATEQRQIFKSVRSRSGFIKKSDDVEKDDGSPS